MSAEVPKLHRRLRLADPGPFGDRPTAEVVVVLTDPLPVLPLPSDEPLGGQPLFDDSAMAFAVVHRCELV